MSLWRSSVKALGRPDEECRHMQRSWRILMQKSLKRIERVGRTVTVMGVLMTLILSGTAGGAFASPSTSGRDVKAVVQSVFASPNPEAAISALSGQERAFFIASFSNLTTDSVVGSALPATSLGVSSGLGASTLLGAAGNAIIPTAASGCWYQYVFTSWYDLGIHTGDTWMQLNWCSNGFSVTSYYSSNMGGAGFNGVSYDGIIGQYSNNLGWEVRYAVGYKFHIGPAVANPCMQIRGGATGLYSYRSSCNLS